MDQNQLPHFLVLAFNEDFDEVAPIAGPHDFEEAKSVAEQHRRDRPEQQVCIIPCLWVAQA